MVELKYICDFIYNNRDNSSASVLWIKVNNAQHLQNKIGYLGFSSLSKMILDKMPLKNENFEIKVRVVNEVIVLATKFLGRQKAVNFSNKLYKWFQRTNFLLKDKYLFINVNIAILTDLPNKKDVKYILSNVERNLLTHTQSNQILFLGESKKDTENYHYKLLILNSIKSKKYNWKIKKIIPTKTNNYKYYQPKLFLTFNGSNNLTRNEYVSILKQHDLFKTLNRITLMKAIDTIQNLSQTHKTFLINQNLSDYIKHNSLCLDFLFNLDVPKNSLIFQLRLEDLELNSDHLEEFSNTLNSLNIKICLSGFNCSKQSWKIARKTNAKWLKLKRLCSNSLHQYEEKIHLISKTITKAHTFGYKVFMSKVDCNYLASDLWKLDIDFIQGDFINTTNKELCFKLRK